jgi:DNA-binding NtrC family response regulator
MRDREAVLVVDHDLRACEALVAALGRAGYAAEGTGDLFTAVARAIESKPQVVVSEIWMPDGPGLDLIKAMRHRGLEVPVVFLARGETKDLCTCATAYGAEACLPRPVVVDDLVWTMERAIARRDSLVAPRRRVVSARREETPSWWGLDSGLAWAR